MSRANLVSRVVEMILDIERDHPVRVGIDGVDASGKTCLANEIGAAIKNKGRGVIVISIDSFNNPREIRYKQGEDSPQGYYEDSFNIDAIVKFVLTPLGPGGSLAYKETHFDLKKNSPTTSPQILAKSNSVLLFEGVFLHQPLLADYWDFSIFVQADFDTTLTRALERDRNLFDSPAMIRDKYNLRYIPGQKIYLESESPASKADLIWNNNDIKHPTIDGIVSRAKPVR